MSSAIIRSAVAAARARGLRGPGEALSVALSGHRWNRIDPAQAPALGAALAALFSGIDAAAAAPEHRLITGMAEGADLTAVSALPESWRLAALLPLDPASWRAHLAGHATGNPAQAVGLLDAALARPDTRIETLPPGADSLPDYVGLCVALLAAADILVAVWNGKPGMPGGTADAVARARAAGLPVIRLWRDRKGGWQIME